MRLVSHDGNCPYCKSTKTTGEGFRNGKRNLSCNECGKHFISTKTDTNRIEDRVRQLPIVRLLRKGEMYFNAYARDQFDLSDEDGIDFEFSKKGIQLKKMQDSFIVLRRKDKNYARYTLCCIPLSMSVWEEFDLPYNQPINLIIDKMGFITRAELEKKKVVKFKYGKFLSVRPNGTTSISAALRIDAELKEGHYAFIYEKEDKSYIMFSTQNRKLDKEKGFRIMNQGSKGFSNYIAVGTTSLAVYLLERYKKKPKDSLRIYIGEAEEVDGYVGYELLQQ